MEPETHTMGPEDREQVERELEQALLEAEADARYTFDEYQNAASRTLIHKPNFQLSAEELMIIWNALGLAGEVGEICNRIKKIILHRGDPAQLFDDEMMKELGDALWYHAALCTKLGMDMGEIAEGNIRKLWKRFPEGWDEGKSRDKLDET